MCLLRVLRYVNVLHAQLEFPGGEYIKDILPRFEVGGSKSNLLDSRPIAGVA